MSVANESARVYEGSTGGAEVENIFLLFVTLTILYVRVCGVCVRFCAYLCVFCVRLCICVRFYACLCIKGIIGQYLDLLQKIVANKGPLNFSVVSSLTTPPPHSSSTYPFLRCFLITAFQLIFSFIPIIFLSSSAAHNSFRTHQ